MQGVQVLAPVRRGGPGNGAEAVGLWIMQSIPFKKLVFTHAQRRVLRAWRIEEKGSKQPLRLDRRDQAPYHPAHANVWKAYITGR